MLGPPVSKVAILAPQQGVMHIIGSRLIDSPVCDGSCLRAFPGFAGHGNHYCGFGVAAAEG
jgi:hypothetical protein